MTDNARAIRVFTYRLVASNGKHIRNATAVKMPDGSVIRFTEKMTKREAIKAVSA
jgi:hypothetical protein